MQPSRPPEYNSPKTNIMAVISLVIGIFTWSITILVACPITVLIIMWVQENPQSPEILKGMPFLFTCILLIGWLACFAIGIVAYYQIRRQPQKGDALAISGIVLGGLGLGSVTALVLLFVLFICILSFFFTVIGIIFF
jgi:hypothetical protein